MADDTLAQYNEAFDTINETAMKLRAMLAVTYGEQGCTFRNLNDGLQDHFMWACSNLIDTITEAVEQLYEHRRVLLATEG